MVYDNCLLCGSNLATKKNSHIIPSFLQAPIFNYDGTDDRGKEIMFTLSSCDEKVYLGAVRDIKIEELFDKDRSEYDERTMTEFRENTTSKDNIFCPKCENDLSKYLETPYANSIKSGTPLAPDISYFFWESIVWRISISQQYGVKLDQRIEENLGKSLSNYFNAKDKNEDPGSISKIICNCWFNYRIIKCPGFLKNNPGIEFAKYDTDNKVLSVVIGDLILFASFAGEDFPASYSFWDAEKPLSKASVNNGSERESICEVPEDVILHINDCAIKALKQQKISFEHALIDKCWINNGYPGHIPDEVFKTYLSRLLDEKTKLGDRFTNQHRVEVLNDTVTSFGFKLK